MARFGITPGSENALGVDSELIQSVALPQFRAGLVEPKLVDLFDYWVKIRRGRRMPEWRDIQPEELGVVLPYIWVWKFDPAGQPRLRLIGEEVAPLAGMLRGKTLGELFPWEYAEEIAHDFAEVANQAACCHLLGNLMRSTVALGQGERLILPYGSPESGERGVLGASFHGKASVIYRSPKSYSRLVGERRFLYPE